MKCCICHCVEAKDGAFCERCTEFLQKYTLKLDVDCPACELNRGEKTCARAECKTWQELSAKIPDRGQDRLVELHVQAICEQHKVVEDRYWACKATGDVAGARDAGLELGLIEYRYPGKSLKG